MAHCAFEPHGNDGPVSVSYNGAETLSASLIHSGTFSHGRGNRPRNIAILRPNGVGPGKGAMVAVVPRRVV